MKPLEISIFALEKSYGLPTVWGYYVNQYGLKTYPDKAVIKRPSYMKYPDTELVLSEVEDGSVVYIEEGVTMNPTMVRVFTKSIEVEVI
jgi:hypothetical protein